MVKRKLGSKGGGGHGGDSVGDQQKMSQVFLRNLPLDMLEPDMETMLADCGPIKRIDLIKTTDPETGAKKSRGFGFVTFALEADATKSVQTIHGKRVMGREISCEIALKKGSKKERSLGGSGGRAPTGSRGTPSEILSTAADEEATTSNAQRTSEGGGGGGSEKKTRLKTLIEAPVGVEGNYTSAGADASVGTRERHPEGGDVARRTVEGRPSKASDTEAEQPPVAGGGAEAGAGLSKKEARKIARKATKKEVKHRAKERAREKTVRAAEKASYPEATTPAGADRGEVGKASSGGNRVHGEEEILDARGAKLKADARTVIVFGVADDLTAKQLLKRIKKCTTVSSLDLKENERQYFPGGRIAHVVCAAKEGTRKVIDRLDGHTVHGQTLRIRRLLEIVAGDDIRQQKQQRLIVRNLSFLAKEDDLVKTFSEFGPLSEVHLPTVRVTSQKRIPGTGKLETVTRDRTRGFGFVQFLCPRDASRVVKDHGVLKICGRDAAVDFSITKDKYDALRQAESKETDTAFPADGDADLDNDHDSADRVDPDPVADESNGEGVDDAMDVAAVDGNDSDTPDDQSESANEIDEEEGEEEGGPDAAAGVGRGSVRTRREPDVQQGCTVFVRNVAFDCGEDELTEKFREFGVVRLALVVKDRATGMPRGTAFVKFSNKGETDRCLAAAIGATDPAHARDSGGSCIFLGSRALHVTRAVDREEAGRLTVGAQQRKGHKDKRNLYLANEGLVLEDSSAAEGAPKVDLEKRVAARRDKKTKLKNPLFFVSPVRLSVRNLARHVTDGKLKAMVVAAARAGIEAGRATPQDVRLYLEAQGEEFAAITPKRLQIPAVTPSSVVKVKIIRDMDKKPSPEDPSQLHPSKGYGFVEFVHHGQALAALRHMNNNPAFSGHARSDGASKGESSRLIVEFSVENHAKLKQQQSRKEAFEERKRELRALGLGQDGRPLQEREKTKSRGKNQREIKKETGAAVDRISETLTTGPEANAEETIETGRTASETKKRKRRGDEAKGGNRREGGRVAVLGNDGDSDDRVHGHVGGEGENKGEGSTLRTSGRGKKKKKANHFERADAQERAYQKLERSYTAKTEAVAKAASEGAKRASGKKGLTGKDGEGGKGSDAARTMKQGGRWFDSV